MIRPVLSIRLHKLSLLGGSEARKHILDALKKAADALKKTAREGTAQEFNKEKEKEK